MADLTLLDPAMLADHSHRDGEPDSGWEYEYHESQTETLYLNLDLSSLHGPLRPPRRPNNTPKTSATAEEAADFSRPVESTEAEPDETTTTTTDAAATAAEDRLQILGLHTGNPLVAYQNQIFSCAWADQVGTELFFTPPDEIPGTTATPLTRGRDYDLVAANRVKILGHKANLISGSEPSTSTSTAATATATTTAKPTNQAQFLDRLASIKQAKGETDAVRTVFSTRRTQNVEDRLRGWARTEEQMADIQRLQEGVLRGDPQAVTELENLGLTD